jgi:hypothetical protein
MTHIPAPELRQREAECVELGIIHEVLHLADGVVVGHNIVGLVQAV